MPKIKSGGKIPTAKPSRIRDKIGTTKQLKEELRKTRKELAIQKWGLKKTLKGMKALVRALAKELLQKKEVVVIQKWGLEKTLKGMKALVKELIQKKKELAEANENLEQANKVKSEFVSIASHQLRTPLIGIQWLTELLEKEKLTDKGQKYLSDIRTSIQRLNKLVELLLNVSRIEEGKIEISPQSIDVVNFTKKIVDNLAVLYDSKKRLSFTFTADEKKIIVLTDVSALQNIAQSILSNAVEYTPEGGKIEVKIKKHGQMFLLTVSDTGIGIPKKDQGRIFQEFVRASNAGRLKAAGMGLGLWIAKRATELLGGKIWFESQENKGTTFFVELPIKSKSIDGTKKLA